MKETYRKLVSDTVAFLKQEGPPKLKQPFKPPIKPIPIPPPAPIPEPTLPPQPKEEKNAILEKIQKHLPHVRLIKEIPSMNRVAIFCTDSTQLPFCEKLAAAIRQRFCPVDVCTEEPKGQFLVILTPKELLAFPKERQILLESIDVYENNMQQKKQLWSSICHHLSQK